tara:strand:+ start:118 stop:783 length:666 start_codon:yes stop_codon:yes gene_type:complete
MFKQSQKIFLILVFILFPLKSHADLLGGLTGGLTGGSSGGFDLAGGKTELVDAFFSSNSEYLEALRLLHLALGKNTEAEQLQKAIEYANDPGISEEDRMKNSIKTTNEASQSIESDLNNQSLSLSAEGKVFYAQSLPPAGKGLIGTIKMIPITKNMVDGIKANPISAVTQIGGLSKVIPNIPGYIQTVQKTMQMIQSKAKAEGIDGADDPNLSAQESDFDL